MYDNMKKETCNCCASSATAKRPEMTTEKDELIDMDLLAFAAFGGRAFSARGSTVSELRRNLVIIAPPELRVEGVYYKAKGFWLPCSRLMYLRGVGTKAVRNISQYIRKKGGIGVVYV